MSDNIENLSIWDAFGNALDRYIDACVAKSAASRGSLKPHAMADILIGKDLDDLGEIYGVVRGVETDEAYRGMILARITDGSRHGERPWS